MQRLFLSLDLAIPVIELLLGAMDEIDDALAGDEGGAQVQWRGPAQLRMTLKQIGPVDSALVGVLCAQLRELVAPLFPFQLESHGIEGWPQDDAARLVWGGFDASGAEVLSLLQRTVERDLEQLGVAPDPRPFVPRMLLGHVTTPGNRALGEALEEHAQRHYGTSIVRDLVLYEAQLRPEGPRYVVVDRFVLGEAR